MARRLMNGESERLAWANSVVRCFQVLRLATDRLPLELLEQALAISPVLPAVASECLALAGMRRFSGANPPDETILFRKVAEGRIPVVAHVLAGLRALRANDLEGAQLHFEIGQRFFRRIRCGCSLNAPFNG